MESRRPSLGFGLGVAALVVAASGTALAVPSVHSAINGSTIKNHSIAGKKLINNTVTGKQIKESTLGTVPSAANATKLGGVGASGYVPAARFFHFSIVMAKGAAARTIGTYGPLTFHASCAADGSNTNAQLTATSSASNVFVYSQTPTVMSAGQTITIAARDSATANDADYEYPSVFTSNNSLTLDDGDAVFAAVNTVAGACLFGGHLMNVAH